MTEAVPEAIVTGPDGLNVAEGPLVGGGERHHAAIDRVTGAIRRHAHLQRVGNAVPTIVDWLLPADDGQGEARRLEGADVHGAVDDPRRGPRWSVVVAGRDQRSCCRRRWPGCRAAGPWSGVGPP